jgi:energy-coupling factor transporter ATP-binding protein EcfA2
MKIAAIHIKNFRAFADENINLNDYTCLVGPNGGGKSTVLYALNIFFQERTTLTGEDFHQKHTGDPIEITLTFTDLDDQQQKDFAHYVRQGRLVVSSVGTFDPSAGTVDLTQYGERLGMNVFRPYFAAVGENKKAAELKEIYTKLREEFHELPDAGTKDRITNALHEYEAAHSQDCTLLRSSDQFYGFTKGTNLLAPHIQWVYVPAVKDATAEQVEARDSALGKLLARTVRATINFEEGLDTIRATARTEYDKLLQQQQASLNALSTSLQARLREWAHPNVNLRVEWTGDPDKSVRIDQPFAHVVAGEDQFEGELSHLGHGFQRSYLLALLQELAGASSATGPSGPRLLLGCEEPELYQHPPQARHLAAVLRKLSGSNSQVIVATHSPYFVSGNAFDDVRMVRKDQATGASQVTQVSYKCLAAHIGTATGQPYVKPSGALAKIHQLLQSTLGEMFFTQRLILVEGPEDVAYLTTYFALLGKEEEYRQLGCHLVPTNGKSQMIYAVALAKAMSIPTFAAFDADADKPDQRGSRAKHENDNKALLRLCGASSAEPMPKQDYWGDGCVMWASDIGTVVKNDIGENPWKSYQEKADVQYGHAGNLRKNTLHIGASLALAWDDAKESACLRRLCEEILRYAAGH